MVSRPRLSAGIEDEGKLWRAVIKVTEDRNELFLMTLHRARPNDLRAARRDLQRTGREEG